MIAAAIMRPGRLRREGIWSVGWVSDPSEPFTTDLEQDQRLTQSARNEMFARSNVTGSDGSETHPTSRTAYLQRLPPSSSPPSVISLATVQRVPLAFCRNNNRRVSQIHREWRF